MSETIVKDEWTRAKDALEIVLKHFSLKQIEDLATKLENPKFKGSLKYNILKSAVTSM